MTVYGNVSSMYAYDDVAQLIFQLIYISDQAHGMSQSSIAVHLGDAQSAGRY